MGIFAAAARRLKSGSLVLHQLGLTLEEGLLYRRECGRFYLVPRSTLPPALPASAVALPWRQGWESLWPHLRPYEDWVRRQRPGYRNRLLRIRPPQLRPQRRKWKEIFGFSPP